MPRILRYQASVASLVALLLLAACSVKPVLGETRDRHKWTLDLVKYGYHRAGRDAANDYDSNSQVATTGDVVAVAIGNPAATAHIDAKHQVYEAQTDVFLYLLDAKSGELITRRGPWLSDYFFELHATAKGNFLLLLRHLHDGTSNHHETLYLLSSLGEELKKIDLAPSFSKDEPSWNKALISSSGRTLVVGQSLKDGVRYEVLEADTLETRYAWTAGKESPWIIGISDSDALGLGTAKSEEKQHAAGEVQDLFIRTFDGPWRAFPAYLDLSSHLFGSGLTPEQFSFLDQDLIVALNREQKLPEQPIRLLRTDGTLVVSPATPRLPAHSWLDGPVIVADQGRYFAVGFRHRPWLSHLMLDVMEMDMAFQDDETSLVVWRASDLVPVARIELGEVHGEISCSTGTPATIAYLIWSELEVIRASFDQEKTASKQR